MKVLTTVNALATRACLAAFDQVQIVKNVGTDPLAKLGGFIGLIFYIMMVGGAGLAAFGLYEFGIGISKEGQAEKKLQGMLCFAGGLILFSAKFIMGPKGFGLIA